MIHLIGPGGAGKSTVAPYLAAHLDAPLVDLDRAFEAAHGDIDHFIEAHGYAAYAAANVDTYLAHRSPTLAVFAMSSGFMVYPEDIHPAIRALQRDIATAPTTVLLLPSLDLEICVSETVRRQAGRPLALRRSAAREEAVIRERFASYCRLTSRVVTTMQPPQDIVREILVCLTEARDALMSATLHPISYRPAVIDDVPAMVLLRERSGWSGGAGAETMRSYLAGSHHPQQALEPRIAFLAERGGELVGFVAGHLTARFGCDGELQWLLVAPAARGAAVGTALVVRLAAWFAAEGAARVCVNVAPENSAARRLYARLGAVELSEYWMVWPDIAAAGLR